jgi:hypothetical protein
MEQKVEASFMQMAGSHEIYANAADKQVVEIDGGRL